MANRNRPSVALLFMGGSTIDDRDRSGDAVRTAADVKPWMKHMSEMDIIAETDGFFVTSGIEPVGLSEWITAAKLIQEHYDRFDGFVIIHQSETIPAAATALSLIFTTIGKPIVIVGSSLLSSAEKKAGRVSLLPGAGEFGAKASIINAVQVAVSDVAETVVIYGSHVFRGGTVFWEASGDGGHLQGETLGKIDFGMRFFGQQQRRSSKAPAIKPSFDSDVAVSEYIPGVDVKHIISHARGRSGLFLSSPEGPAPAIGIIAKIVAALPNLPIMIFSPRSSTATLPANVVLLTGHHRVAALLTFMWVLGQKGNWAQQRKLLKQVGGKA